MIFIIGTGKVIALSPPKYLYKGRFLKSRKWNGSN